MRKAVEVHLGVARWTWFAVGGAGTLPLKEESIGIIPVLDGDVRFLRRTNKVVTRNQPRP